MKRKKSYLAIIVIIILIIIYIIQLIAYKKMIKKFNKTMDDGKEYSLSNKASIVEDNSAAIYPRNIKDFMTAYGGENSNLYIGQRIFKFINEDVNYIYNYCKDKDEETVRYNIGQNNENINDIKISSPDDIINLNKQISLLKSVNMNNTFNKCSFELETIAKNNTYCRCVLNLEYDYNTRILIKLNIPYVKEEPIIIENYDPIDKIYENYNGPVKKEEINSLLDEYKDFAFYYFNQKFSEQSVGFTKSFYDLNEEFVQKYKIYSRDDLDSASMGFRGFSMTAGTKITYIDVEKSDVQDKNYEVWNFTFHNSENEGVGEFRFYLAKQSNISPTFKVSGIEDDNEE